MSVVQIGVLLPKLPIISQCPRSLHTILLLDSSLSSKLRSHDATATEPKMGVGAPSELFIKLNVPLDKFGKSPQVINLHIGGELSYCK